MPTASRQVYIEETEEELMKMTRQEATLGLNEREIAFCEYFTHSKNVNTAAIRAGYKKTSASVTGWKIRQKEGPNRYIAWLKLRVSNSCHVKAMDIIDMYQRIAFADMNEVVNIRNGRATPKNGDEIDGQLISKISTGVNGFTVELESRENALKKLEQYFDVMPKDWKYQIELKKLEIMELRLELEKEKAGLNDQEEVETNFVEALGLAVKDAWKDEKEETIKDEFEDPEEEDWDQEDDEDWDDDDEDWDKE